MRDIVDDERRRRSRRQFAARRVDGGEAPSASLPLLSDVPHRLRRGASHLSPRRRQRRTRCG